MGRKEAQSLSHNGQIVKICLVNQRACKKFLERTNEVRVINNSVIRNIYKIIFLSWHRLCHFLSSWALELRFIFSPLCCTFLLNWGPYLFCRCLFCGTLRVIFFFLEYLTGSYLFISSIFLKNLPILLDILSLLVIFSHHFNWYFSQMGLRSRETLFALAFAQSYEARTMNNKPLLGVIWNPNNCVRCWSLNRFICMGYWSS